MGRPVGARFRGTRVSRLQSLLLWQDLGLSLGYAGMIETGRDHERGENAMSVWMVCVVIKR